MNTQKKSTATLRHNKPDPNNYEYWVVEGRTGKRKRVKSVKGFHPLISLNDKIIEKIVS